VEYDVKQRERMLLALAQMKQQGNQPMKPQEDPSFWENALDFAGNAAPIAGTAIGAGIGLLGGPFAGITAPVGAAVGGGVGSLAGLAAHAGRDGMRQDRDKRAREEEEKQRMRLAKQQALMSLM
jgi:purine-cytosine permease-like protein